MVINELVSEGYVGDNSVIAIVGRPSENALFAKRAAWKAANSYARFGESAWPGGHGGYRSWAGVLAECCGIRLNLCTEEEYKNLIQTKELAEMPVFPMEGSIREIDGVVVVKVSGVY